MQDLIIQYSETLCEDLILFDFTLLSILVDLSHKFDSADETN